MLIESFQPIFLFFSLEENALEDVQRMERTVKGTCRICGRVIRRISPVSLVVICDCYRYCPLCEAEMTPFTPDMDPKVYKFAEEQGWNIETLYVCMNHRPPYYSIQSPMEVLLE